MLRKFVRGARLPVVVSAVVGSAMTQDNTRTNSAIQTDKPYVVLIRQSFLFPDILGQDSREGARAPRMTGVDSPITGNRHVRMGEKRRHVFLGHRGTDDAGSPLRHDLHVEFNVGHLPVIGNFLERPEVVFGMCLM